MHVSVEQVREIFAEMLRKEAFVKDKTGAKLLEIVGASFVVTDNVIFGKINSDYVEREIAWYNSQSRNVNDLEKTPQIWKDIADKNGMINSNYGWVLFSGENFFQYRNVLNTLIAATDSRRAVAIYNRPTMHIDAFDNGRKDFMCTNAVQYVIRGKQLATIVQMRSNDVWAGFRNDLAWQLTVAEQLVKDYNANRPKGTDEVERGPIFWQVGSLHVYEKDFYLVDHYNKTRDEILALPEEERKDKKPEHFITKAEYTVKYPDSVFVEKEEE